MSDNYVAMPQELPQDENERVAALSIKKMRANSSFKVMNCCSFHALMFVSICFLCIGSYFVYDTPGAIFSSLQDWFESGGKSWSNAQNLNMYSVYSQSENLHSLSSHKVLQVGPTQSLHFSVVLSLTSSLVSVWVQCCFAVAFCLAT